MKGVRNFIKEWAKPSLVILTHKDKVLLDQGRMIHNLLPDRAAKKTLNLENVAGLAFETVPEKLGRSIVDFIKDEFVEVAAQDGGN